MVISITCNNLPVKGMHGDNLKTKVSSLKGEQTHSLSQIPFFLLEMCIPLPFPVKTTSCTWRMVGIPCPETFNPNPKYVK